MAVPLIAAGVAAAGSIAGGAMAASRGGYRPGVGFGGRGKSYQGQYEGGYDPNAFEYGGSRQAGDALSEGYQRAGNDAQGRVGVQADFAAAQADRQNAALARAQQEQALGLQRDAALGNAPSVAQLQMQAGQDQAMRGQEAMRASARGAAGVAMADYGAAANIAATQQQTTQQMGVLRAQEMAQARDAYMQGATGMRGMDYQGAQQAAGMAQFQAEQEMRQREMNDRYSLGLYGAAEGIRGQQMHGQLQRMSALQNAYQEQERLMQAAKAGQAAQTMQGIQMGLGGVTGAASALATAYGQPGGKP